MSPNPQQEQPVKESVKINHDDSISSASINMMNYETFLNYLSFTATATTICLFLCGIQICFRIRKKGSTEGTAVAPFLLTSISCICWLGYGVLKMDSTVIFVNSIGLAIQSIYLMYYYAKTRLKSRLNRLIFLELLSAALTYIFIYSIYSDETKENILGVICMLLNIATIASPLADVGQVLRTKSTESLPLMLCVANTLVTSQWFVYGVLVDDFYMKFPNGVSVIISLGQLSLFLIYPRNYKVLIVPSKHDADSLL